jgi:3-hydroxybutyryl-CoA dehydratase
VSPVTTAHRAGHAPELDDAPASGAPAESVPANEQALGAPAPASPANGAPTEPPGVADSPAPAPAALAAAAAALFGCPFGALSEGDRFITAARVVQEPDILEFADLTGDVHPQHVDPEWAAGSRFGEQIAHGLLVLSFAVGLLPLDAERVVALRRVGDAVFKQPVRIGDTLHVEGEISRMQELDPEHGLVEARIRIVNQHGRLAVRASVELVWRA